MDTLLEDLTKMIDTGGQKHGLGSEYTVKCVKAGHMVFLKRLMQRAGGRLASFVDDGRFLFLFQVMEGYFIYPVPDEPRELSIIEEYVMVTLLSKEETAAIGLGKQMNKAVAVEDYENAALLRNRITRLTAKMSKVK